MGFVLFITQMRYFFIGFVYFHLFFKLLFQLVQKLALNFEFYVTQPVVQKKSLDSLHTLLSSSSYLV